MDEKIKTGIYIYKDSKSNLDKLKSFGIKPNDFFDKILKFDKEGLALYIDLLNKYNDYQDGFIFEEPYFYCTNNKEELSKINITGYDRIDKLDIIDKTNEKLQNEIDVKINNKNEMDLKIKELEEKLFSQGERLGKVMKVLSHHITLFKELKEKSQ